MPVLPLVLTLLAAAYEPVPDTFYNRAGATPETLATELRLCRMITTRTHGAAVEGRALTPPVVAPGAPPPDADVADATPARAPTIEDCMVTRGWRLYALSQEDRATLEMLDADARSAALARLTGANCPAIGTLLREGPVLRLRQQ